MPFTLSIGSFAPKFCLAGVDGSVYSLDSFIDFPYLVVFFTCNHCPYVIASDPLIAEVALKYRAKGVGFAGINSNSPEHYGEDSFAHMVQRMQEHNFPWFYLYDPTQDVARSYGALRTPHYFVFDQERKLVYCGRGLDQPKNPEKSTINDLDNALDDLVSGRPIHTPLTNPIGCNVKWKGHDKHWMPEEACDLVL